MVTNINLVSPEAEKKEIVSGKTSLFLSLGLLLITMAVYGGIVFLNNKYSQEKEAADAAIQIEQAKISGPIYADVADFQERVEILGKVVQEHYYWSDYMKDFSKFILPEVVLNNFAGEENADSVKISGSAPNYDVLAKQLILLRSFPGASSIEFEGAKEEEGRVSFDASFTINGDSLKRDGQE